jgi:hypothetical protein
MTDRVSRTHRLEKCPAPEGVFAVDDHAYRVVDLAPGAPTEPVATVYRDKRGWAMTASPWSYSTRADVIHASLAVSAAERDVRTDVARAAERPGNDLGRAAIEGLESWAYRAANDDADRDGVRDGLADTPDTYRANDRGCVAAAYLSGLQAGQTGGGDEDPPRRTEIQLFGVTRASIRGAAAEAAAHSGGVPLLVASILSDVQELLVLAGAANGNATPMGVRCLDAARQKINVVKAIVADLETNR